MGDKSNGNKLILQPRI